MRHLIIPSVIYLFAMIGPSPAAQGDEIAAASRAAATACPCRLVPGRARGMLFADKR